MKGYLLDTSTCVAIFRGNRDVANKMEEVGKDKCFISQIVVAELLFGAYRSNRVEENLKLAQAFIEEMNVLPFEVNSEKVDINNVREDLRLQYRYIDLRNDRIHNSILLRSKIIKMIRDEMEKKGFPEIQTPILANSSPEGARDYLVPSRLHAGKFYALPQAPQQFKQLLMISGFDKYYQIAPCFRDEDPRADRAPGEFYQWDMEMSFATQEDVFAVIEDIMPRIYENFTTWTVDKAPFLRIPYAEAMEKYGIDKPDLRNPLIITDVTKHSKEKQ